MATDELLKLTWNGHVGTFLSTFESLRTKAKYTDVTLACDGKLFAAHRLVLASCSQFFDSLFEQTPSENTIIVLNDAKKQDIQAIISFMYSGEVEVPRSQLSTFLDTASSLQIKGLVSENNDDENSAAMEERSVEKSNCPPPKKRKMKTPPRPEEFPHLASALRRANDNISSSCNGSIAATPPNNRWVFHRSDLPNTTWSNNNTSGARHHVVSHREVDATSDALAISSIVTGGGNGMSFHPRVPEFRSKKCFSKDGGCPPNKIIINHGEVDESIGFHDNDQFKCEKDIKEEFTEIAIDGYENGSSEYENCREIYDHYDLYNSPGGSSSPNASPHHSKSNLNASTINKTHGFLSPRSAWKRSYVESNNGGGPDRGNNSAVSAKLLPFARCSNCGTNNTKLWRRSMNGDIVCNACGLYFKLHCVNRPSHLFRNEPMTRRRNPRKQKKKSYEEILDARQHASGDEQNDLVYYNNEGSADADTQDGLAVLNAALTLNSLFVKAQETAKEPKLPLRRQQQFTSPSSSPVPVDSPAEGVGPPPPLLKLPVRPPPLNHSQTPPNHSQTTSQENSQPRRDHQHHK